MIMYNAKSIKVLSSSDAEVVAPWAALIRWEQEYNKSPVWMQRGFDTCMILGLSPKYFEVKYLMKKPLSSIGLEEVVEFGAVFSEVTKRSVK